MLVGDLPKVDLRLAVMDLCNNTSDSNRAMVSIGLIKAYDKSVMKLK